MINTLKNYASVGAFMVFTLGAGLEIGKLGTEQPISYLALFVCLVGLAAAWAYDPFESEGAEND
jgi:hypothetical protein